MTKNKNYMDDSEIKHSVYQAIRDQVVHEDNLVNQRFTWMLSSNAFLLTGFFVLLTNIDRFDGAPLLLMISVSVVCLAGFFLCFFLWREISKNRIVYRELKKLWYSKYPEEGLSDLNNDLSQYPDKQYPDVHHNAPKIKFSKGTQVIGATLMCVWLALLALNVYIYKKFYEKPVAKKEAKRYPLIRKSSFGSDTTVFIDTVYVP